MKAMTAKRLARVLEQAPESDRAGILMRVFAGLPTIDIPNVPILAAGGPYFGTGSPEGGDFFTKEDLELIADQTNKLESAGELRPPSKLGHSDEQRLLENSGLPVGDELPAAGWLTNFRVEKVTGIWKLLADVKQVPAKLGQILASGGYRTRSVELSRVTSQVDQQTYDGVVTGLAWLGAKAPAVRTLDDIFNWYADSAEGKSFAIGDVVWEEENGIMDLMSDLTEAINEEATPDAPSWMWNFWVTDINLALDQCVVEDWDGDETWIVGFTIADGDEPNEPTVAARDTWTAATMKLVEIDPAAYDDDGEDSSGPWMDPLDDYSERRRAARAHFRERSADTKSMKLTDKQIAELAKTFSIEGEGAELRTKVEAHMKSFGETTEPPAPTPTPTPTPAPAPEPTPPTVALSSFSEEQRTQLAAVIGPLEERAARGDRAFADRFAEARDTRIFAAISEGRLNPSDREDWVEFFNANPELAAKQLKALPVNPGLLLTYGVDDDGLTTEQRTEGNQAVEDAYLAATGATSPVAAPAGGAQ